MNKTQTKEVILCDEILPSGVRFIFSKGGEYERCPDKKAQGGGHGFREGNGWRNTCYFCGKNRL
jgi:hypothetical protein